MSQQSLVAMILRGLPCKEGASSNITADAFGPNDVGAALPFAETAANVLRSEIATQAASYYAEQGWDSLQLVTSLRATFRRTCDPRLLRMLGESLRQAMGLRHHLKHVLYAFHRLTIDERLTERLAAEHIVSFAAAFDDLMLIRPRPTRRAWQSLEHDVKVLIADGAMPEELDVYLRLVVTDAKAFPQDAQVDLDLFGELTSAFRELRKSRPSAADLRLIGEAMDQQRETGQSALFLIRAFGSLADVDRGTSAGGSTSLIALYHSALARFSPHATPADLTTFRRHLDHLIQAVGNSEVVSVFAAGAVLFVREGRYRELSKLNSLCEQVHGWIARSQLLRNIVRAIDEGQIVTVEDLLRGLDRAAAHGTLEALRTASKDVTIAAASRAFHEFTAAELGDLATVIKADQSLLDWQRVAEQRERLRFNSPRAFVRQTAAPSPPSALAIDPGNMRTILRLQDKFFGFSALRYAAQRTPTRGTAELARFGNDVGKVSYLNAREVTGFPGRGFFLRELKLHKIFVQDPDGSGVGADPYRAYRRAWPAMAAEFDDLEQAEFLFARGMIVISCRTLSKYNLKFPDGQEQQMSLAIFNDHFRNLLSCEACLIPTAMLRSRLGKCFVGFDDFTGFQPKRPDVNQTIGSIQELLADERYGQYVLSIGNPQSLRTGFPQWHESTNLQIDEALWSRFTMSVEAFNKRLKAWEARGHSYHVSTRGAQENRMLRNTTADLANYAMNLARDDRDRLYQVVNRMREVERPIWKLTEQHLNLLDLLLISWSAWHKGFTQGEIVSREDDSQAEDFDWSPTMGKADRLIVGKDDDVYWNQNAIRMLALAYEWHSQRRRGVLDPQQYPILTVTDALKLGSVDPPDCWLDTFDMVAHIHGNEIPLSLHAMNVDDEQFWHTQFMPLAADLPGKFCDLRFYPRDSLGLGTQGT